MIKLRDGSFINPKIITGIKINRGYKFVDYDMEKTYGEIYQKVSEQSKTEASITIYADAFHIQIS